MKYKSCLLFIVLISCQNKPDKSAQNSIVVPIIDYEKLKESYINKSNEKVKILNFWATWCKPCVAELPDFIRLAAENQNVDLILVNLDRPNQIDPLVIPFLQKNKISNAVVNLNDPDMNNWINDIDPSWSGAIPATLIISHGNKQFYEGSLSIDELKKIIENE